MINCGIAMETNITIIALKIIHSINVNLYILI